MKKLFYLLILFSVNVFAQQKVIIEGLVLDKKTAEPLPFVNVFLEGTTIGTQTDSSGKYSFKNIEVGQYRLVASMIGYKTVVQVLVVEKSKSLSAIYLQEDAMQLQEVKIVGNRDKAWERNYKTFEKMFLGEHFNNKEVKIVNKEVIDFTFDKDRKVLYATANQAIMIENNTLGYKLNYILQNFEYDYKTINYKGLTHFELLKPANEAERTYWQKNRTKAFAGSLNHFLKALIANNLAESGFDAFYLNPNFVNTSDKSLLFYDLSNNRHFPLNTAEMVQSSTETWKRINFNYPIELVYNKKRLNKGFFSDAPYPYSILIPKEKIEVNKNGFLQNPYAIEMKGEMGKRAMADLLPNDYSDTNETDFIAENPQQLIYVHTNKEHYRNQESIWFKSYLVDSQSKQFLNFPQKIYVELFSLTNFQTPLVQQVFKTKETSIAYGAIHLPELPSGNYLLRAYSNAMRNAPENASVIEKSIYIENPTSEYAIVEVKNSDSEGNLLHKESLGADDNLIPKLLLHNKSDDIISLSLANSLGGEFSLSVSEDEPTSTMSAYFEMNSKERKNIASVHTAKTMIPSYEPLRIEGKLLDENKKILPQASITAVALTTAQAPINAKTDSKGIFYFDNIEFEDSTVFVVKVKNKKGKEVLAKIDWQNTSIKSYFPAEKRTIEKKRIANPTPPSSVEIKKDFSEQMLNEVSVKAKRDENGEYDVHGNPYWKIYGKADGVIKVDKNTGGQTIMDVIRGRIPGIQIRENHGFYTYMHRGITTLSGNGKAGGMPKSSAELFLGESFSDVPPLFLLDGVVYDAPRDDSSPLMHIPVQEIDKIEYLVNEGTSLFGARAAGGVISIFSKRGNTIIDTPSKLSNITLKGFESFKTPKNTEEKPNDTTLWIPSFRLSNNVTFDVKIPKMADRKIVITIEGITDEGTPLSLTKIVELKK